MIAMGKLLCATWNQRIAESRRELRIVRQRFFDRLFGYLRVSGKLLIRAPNSA